MAERLQATNPLTRSSTQRVRQDAPKARPRTAKYTINHAACRWPNFVLAPARYMRAGDMQLLWPHVFFCSQPLQASGFLGRIASFTSNRPIEPKARTGGRVVECAGLEIQCTFRRTVSSNLTLSAN